MLYIQDLLFLCVRHIHTWGIYIRGATLSEMLSAGIGSAKEVGQAAQDALPDAPKGNPLDSVKGLFGQ